MLPPPCVDDIIVGERREDDEDIEMTLVLNASLFRGLIGDNSDSFEFGIKIGDSECSVWACAIFEYWDLLICDNGLISVIGWIFRLICWMNWGDETKGWLDLDPMLLLKNCNASEWLVRSGKPLSGPPNLSFRG